ncbi:hypothetical protein ABFS83_03G042100 [Erythranthe nasuta]
MAEAKPVSTPLAPHYKLSMNQRPNSTEENEYMKEIPYANIVGSTMYCMVSTRPDLAYALSILSRFMTEPGIEHWFALKSLLKYLKGSKGVGLLYQKRVDATHVVNGYVDSDYAGCLDTRKSLSGYIYTSYGGAISWKSSLQKVVALSTTEAEYIAATEAVKEGLWLRGFFEEMSGKVKEITLHCNSQSALFLMRNPMFHERTKHIEIKLHFIRQVIEAGKVKDVKVASEENPADSLTKPLPFNKFQH